MADHLCCTPVVSRRRLLQSGAAVAGVLGLAACAPEPIDDHGVRAKVDQTPIAAIDDPRVAIATALAAEEVLIAAYAAAVVPGPVQPIVARALADHRDHRARLTTLLATLGGPPRPSGSAKASPPPPTATPGHPDPAAVVVDLLGQELAAVSRYYVLAAGLSDRGQVQLAAAIMSADAQHVASISAALRVSPVPDTFVSATAAKPPSSAGASS